MGTKNQVRAVLLGLLVLSVITVGYGYASTGRSFDSHLGPRGPTDPSAGIVPPRSNVTVITTDSNTRLGLRSGGPRSRSEIVAFASDGSVLYYNDSHTRYWDVDPVRGTRTTVEYLFADHLEESACPDFLDPGYVERHSYARSVDRDVWTTYARAREGKACTRNGIARVNLSTGESTVVYSAITPGKHSSRWHDGDRIDATHYAVADIYLDGVFVVNTTSGRVRHVWNASSTYPRDVGGPYPVDWTHINDVEVLPDGRLMVSVRNMDEVVFLEPDRDGGYQVNRSWTLGTDDDYEVLYEQHNPDFIPAEMGGPAVLVADSENGRVVEYERSDGSWERTWTWRDGRLQWPRDADRLPNGHTLITSSNGNRVFEVDRSGEVVWSVNIAFSYEAERLGTPGESVGGPSATRADLAANSWDRGISSAVKRVVGGKYLNAALYLTPVWMGIVELSALAVGVLVIAAWLLVEGAWSVRSRRSRR